VLIVFPTVYTAIVGMDWLNADFKLIFKITDEKQNISISAGAWFIDGLNPDSDAVYNNPRITNLQGVFCIGRQP